MYVQSRVVHVQSNSESHKTPGQMSNTSWLRSFRESLKLVLLRYSTLWAWSVSQQFVCHQLCWAVKTLSCSTSNFAVNLLWHIFTTEEKNNCNLKQHLNDVFMQKTMIRLCFTHLFIPIQWKCTWKQNTFEWRFKRRLRKQSRKKIFM